MGQKKTRARRERSVFTLKIQGAAFREDPARRNPTKYNLGNKQTNDMRFSGLKTKRLLTLLLFFLWVLKTDAQILINLPSCGIHNQEPAAGECEFLTCIPCDLNGYTGSSAGFGGDPDGDLGPHFCGTIEAVQNIAFFAAVPNMDITVTASNCTLNSGIDLGVMEAYCDNFPLVECAAGDGSNSTTISLNPINIGPHILIIDVDATGPCDIVISVNPPDATIPIVPPIEDIIGDFEVCPGSHNIYQPYPYYNGSIYTWTFPPVTQIIYSITGEEIPIIWGDTGGEVCVTIHHPCDAVGSTFCKTVTVTPIAPTVLPPIQICAEETPYELPWGDLVSSSGTYSTTVQTPEGCDSTLIQTLNIRPAIVKTFPPVELCETGCLTKCGQTFCGYGNYSVTCQSYLGCDSVINFSIVPPNFVSNIEGAGILTCYSPTIMLTAAPSAGVKTWFDEAGQQLGTGNSLTVNNPGTYVLTVSLTLAGETCTKTSSIVITADNTPPAVLATGAELGCDTLPVFVQVDSLTGPASYTWAGPNGFASNLLNPQVTELGMYVVTVINTLTGCSAKDTVWVKSCCSISAGTFDSTLVTVCGEKDLVAGFHGDQHLNVGDSLVFVLYSNPSDPLGSILMYSDTPLFPFVDSLQQLDSIYYIAAMAGSVLPDSTLDFHGLCWAISYAQPVKWESKPSITVSQAPGVVCKGDCLDLLFQFTGTPPFNFHFDIKQNGVLLLSQDVVSDTLQKTITICPSAFIQPQGSGTLNFSVTYFQDLVCNCND